MKKVKEDMVDISQNDNLSEILNTIQDITYKEGHKFTVLSNLQDINKSGLIEVALEYDCHDTSKYPKQKTSDRIRRSSVYLKVSWYKEDVIRRLYDEVIRAEMHEASEYFRYKGKALWHPHVGGEKPEKNLIRENYDIG